MYTRFKMPKNKRNVKMGKYVKKGYSVAKTAVAAYNMATELAALINVEKKYRDYSQISAAINWSGSTFSSFCLPAQGDGVSERVGDSIKVTSCKIRCRLVGSGSGTGNLVRFIVFWDKEGTVGGPSDVLDTTGSVSTPLEYYIKDRMHEFQVLADRVYTINSDQSAYRYITFNFYKKNINKHIKFTEGATTVEKNQLKMIVVSDEDPAGAPPRLWFQARTHYIDN